jgi:hypothetical protein
MTHINAFFGELQAAELALKAKKVEDGYVEPKVAKPAVEKPSKPVAPKATPKKK